MSDTHTHGMMAESIEYSRFVQGKLDRAPIRYDQRPRHYWKKSQKKIRRERRQRMAYKKGGGK